MTDQPSSSAGQTVAIAGLSATQGVTLLLYVSDKIGLTDMTPEVAASIIGVAAAIAAGILHDVERRRAAKRASRTRRAEDQPVTTKPITTEAGS